MKTLFAPFILQQVAVKSGCDMVRKVLLRLQGNVQDSDYLEMKDQLQKLLNRIAGHVIYGHLQSIANELELPEGRASQAMGDSAGAKPKTQIYKVNILV